MQQKDVNFMSVMNVKGKNEMIYVDKVQWQKGST